MWVRDRSANHHGYPQSTLDRSTESTDKRMHDPIPVPLSIVQLTTPLAQRLSLRTLPLHTHEILPTFAFYNFLNLYASPTLSARLFPRTYSCLPERSQKNWDAHVVSLVQSTLINAAAIWVIWKDKERWAMGPGQRVWGYTGAMGMVQGFSSGYFLWDLMAAASRIDVHGPGALAHAAAALAVSMFGFVSLSEYNVCKEKGADNVSDPSAITTASTSFSMSSLPPSSIFIGLWISLA